MASTTFIYGSYIGHNYARVTWTSLYEAIFYNLYKTETAGYATITPYLVGISSPCAIVPIGPAQTLYFDVTGVNLAGEGPRGKQVAITNTDGSPSAPSAPVITLTVIPGTGGGAALGNLSWPAVVGATSYKIYRALTSSPTTLYFSGYLTTYFPDAIPVSTTYHYRVKATNGTGDSGYSNDVSGTGTGT